MIEVSAIIVTRGDVSLDRILETLPYSEVIIWDNSKRPNYSVFSRYLAIEEAKHDVIYFQDDDIIFTAHEELLDAYQPGVLTSNMPSPWWEEQYENKSMALVGAGSLIHRDLPWSAFGRYLAHHPMDEVFLDFCDMVHGVLTPFNRLDLGYEILSYAHDENRLHNSPGGPERKALAIKRAMDIRNISRPRNLPEWFDTWMKLNTSRV